MKYLEQMILSKGKVLPGDILKVDSFLNTQIDIELMKELGKDIYAHFKDCGVTKILTVEASGIGIACITAQFFNCNVVFAKKSRTKNMGDCGVYSADCYSFTHKNMNTLIVNNEFISPSDTVLIIDDFLANGEACKALMSIVSQAKAKLAGIAIEIEKGFQGAGDELRKQGVDLYSLAVIDKMEDGKIVFRS